MWTFLLSRHHLNSHIRVYVLISKGRVKKMSRSFRELALGAQMVFFSASSLARPGYNAQNV